MPTAVWTGTLSFGLVAIPVRLIPATEPKDVRFHLYDRAGRRVRHHRVVEALDEVTESAPEHDPQGGGAEEVGTPVTEPAQPVAWDELMRGRETETGDVVLLSNEEIEQERPQRSRSIDIEDFVALADIDPVSFEKTYYAVPQSSDAARPYVLLHRAMREAERVGIGRFVLRTKPHLVAVRPLHEVLAVETMFFGDEVRDPTTFASGLQTVEVETRELEMAVRLIDMLTTDWDPAAYADTYREGLLRKLAEKQPTRRAPTDPATGAAGGSPAVTMLMAALKESVEASREQRTKRTRKRSG
jgi:DNA end-binding protein Ku